MSVGSIPGRIRERIKRTCRSSARWLSLPLVIGALSGCAKAEVNEPSGPASPPPGDAGVGPVRIAYGPDPLQFGDLRVPRALGPHPVAVVIHGGCWASSFGLDLMDAMSDDFTRAGVATWNIEYRRVGDAGGGYPNTFTDVGLAIDKVRDLAPTYNLDLKAVITVGHSAGGHLAVWAAARHKLPAASALRGESPLPLHAAAPLAGIFDLASYLNSNSCGELVDDLMGGTPVEVPQRYAEASPSKLSPIGVRQALIHGSADDIVPIAQSSAYHDGAEEAGDPEVSLEIIQGADHFDVITPASPKWPQVREKILKLVE